MTFKSILAAGALLGLIACSGAETPKVEAPNAKAAAPAAAEVMAAKTTAVLIYADWCGSCKVLDPKVKEARGLGTIPGLDFVVLDYSAKDAADFYAQAEAVGVESAIRAYLDGTVKTGQLLLVDVDDAKVINKVTKVDAVPEILSKIKAAVSAS